MLLSLNCNVDNQAQEEEVKKNAARGIVMNHTDDLMVPINNRLDEDEIDVSGLDAAVSALSTKSGADEHPERRQKVS